MKKMRLAVSAGVASRWWRRPLDTDIGNEHVIAALVLPNTFRTVLLVAMSIRGSMGGEGKRSDGLPGESNHERHRNIGRDGRHDPVADQCIFEISRRGIH